MYIWCALDLDRALCGIRRAAIEYNTRLRLSELAFTLPQHLSLAISFEVEDGAWREAVELIEHTAKDVPPPTLTPLGVERQGDIIWIAFEKSEPLGRLHSLILNDVKGELGIPPHTFDLDFRYHSTLFLGGDGAALSEMAEHLSKIALPQSLIADGYLIGISESGRAGEYRVVRKIPSP